MTKLIEDQNGRAVRKGFIVTPVSDDVADYIEELETLLLACAEDMYSASGKFKKSTAIKMYNYVNDNGVAI